MYGTQAPENVSNDFWEMNVPTSPRLALLSILIFSYLLSGCASTLTTAAANSASNDATFRNFLVLAITDDYNNRAQFERTVVSRLRAEGATGTAYYEAAGGNTPIDQVSVQGILDGGAFDAVLVTRVLNATAEAKIKTGSAAAKATRRDDGPLDFFRYDYEELDEPGGLEVRTDATLSVGLYSATETAKVWSIELTSKGEDTVGALIDDVADRIVARLARDGRIAQ